MEISVVSFTGKDSAAADDSGKKLFSDANGCDEILFLSTPCVKEDKECGSVGKVGGAAPSASGGARDGNRSCAEISSDDLIRGAVTCERQCFRNPWSMDMMSEHLASVGGIIFAAIVGGQVCGYVSAKLLPSVGEGEVYRVAVLPQFRRRGIAELMLRSVIKAASDSEIDRLFIEVRVGNAPARTCYEKLGWRQITMRKKYYHDPEEDAVIMERAVK